MYFTLIGRFIGYIKLNSIPFILIILSIYDLRIDIKLLLDFFTMSTLIYTFTEHPLAITVLLIAPFLLKSNQFANK